MSTMNQSGKWAFERRNTTGCSNGMNELQVYRSARGQRTILADTQNLLHSEGEVCGIVSLRRNEIGRSHTLEICKKCTTNKERIRQKNDHTISFPQKSKEIKVNLTASPKFKKFRITRSIHHLALEQRMTMKQKNMHITYEIHTTNIGRVC